MNMREWELELREEGAFDGIGVIKEKGVYWLEKGNNFSVFKHINTFQELKAFSYKRVISTYLGITKKIIFVFE